MGCVAFGACCKHPSTTRTKKKRGQIRQSILGYQTGGREDSLLEAIWSRGELLPVQSGMKGETVKWVVDHGGKGGARDQRLTWGWEWFGG